MANSRTNPRSDLRVVAVERGKAILSTGEEVLVKYDKLAALVEQLQQEQCPVMVRLWWTPDGVELVEIHRVGSESLPREPLPTVF